MSTRSASVGPTSPRRLQEGRPIDVVARTVEPHLRRLRIAPAGRPGRRAGRVRGRWRGSRGRRSRGPRPCRRTVPIPVGRAHAAGRAGMSRGRQAAPAQSNGRPPQRGPSTGAPIAALVSIVGLLVLIVMGSVFVMSTLRHSAAAAAGATSAPGDTGPIVTDRDRAMTPNPIVVITPPPDQRPTINGHARSSRAPATSGRLSGLDLTPISSKGTDSAPAWAPDGKSFYVIETDPQGRREPAVPRRQVLPATSPTSRQMNADGSEPQRRLQEPLLAGRRPVVHGRLPAGREPRRQDLRRWSRDFGWIPSTTRASACYQPVELATMTTSGKKPHQPPREGPAKRARPQRPGVEPERQDRSPSPTTIEDGADGAPRIGTADLQRRRADALPAQGLRRPVLVARRLDDRRGTCRRRTAATS